MDSEVYGLADGYYRLLQLIRQRFKLDEDVALGIFREVAEDVRMQWRRNLQGTDDDPLGPDAATRKQLRYLERLGVETEPGLTKAEASEMIDKTLKERKRVAEDVEENPKAYREDDPDEIDVEVIKMG